MMGNSRFMLLAFVICALGLLAAACGYSTPVPNPTGPWYADPAGDDNNDCLSPATACATIQAAVGKADPGSTLYASAGTFSEVVTLSKAIVVQGAGMNDTIISADGNGATVSVAPGLVEINDLTLKNGQSNGNGGNLVNVGADLTLTNVHIELGSANYGGGIHNSGALTLQTVEVVGNAAARGAGIYNAANASLTANNLLVESNPASEAGAGIFNQGELILADSQINSNQVDGDGAGIFNDSDGSVDITNTDIVGNSSTRGYNGGGFYNRNTFSITNGQVNDNQTEGIGGGGYSVGVLTLVDTHFENNHADILGGALYSSGLPSQGAHLDVSGGEWVGNTATEGGALFNYSEGSLVDLIVDDNEAESGGGIVNRQAELALTNVEVTNNRATTSEEGAGGGGILNLAAPSDLLITDSLIANNQVTETQALVRGGGLFSREGRVIIAGTTIEDNSAPGGGGVAIDSGIFELHNSMVQNNHSLIRGGGLSLYPTEKGYQDGPVLIYNSVISGNSTDGSGGGIYSGKAAPQIADSTISGNSAGSQAGGVLLGKGQLVRSALSGNSSEHFGGGVYIVDGETVELYNVTVSGNQAQSAAGVYIAGGDLEMSYVTVADNQSTNGAALVAAEGRYNSHATVRASILADNSGLNCGGSQITSQSANVSDDGSCPFSQPTDQVNTNPMLGPLQNNGGTTETHALLVGSPAVNADICYVSVNQDQRKESRPFGTNCDSGAFEQHLVLQAGVAQTLPACIDVGNLNRASYGGISLRDRGGLLITVDVPGGPPDPESLRGMLGNQAVNCVTDENYPERLFCIAPEMPAGGTHNFRLYGGDCPDPAFDVPILVPIRPTPTPTTRPTACPFGACR
jgi:fibronectin-binding autotransporter adhesin